MGRWWSRDGSNCDLFTVSLEYASLGGHDAFSDRYMLQTGAMINVHEQRRSRNTTSVDSTDTIASRFERHAAAIPDELAIVTDEVSLTYRALDIKSSRIAAALTSL